MGFRVESLRALISEELNKRARNRSTQFHDIEYFLEFARRYKCLDDEAQLKLDELLTHGSSAELCCDTINMIEENFKGVHITIDKVIDDWRLVNEGYH